MLAEPNDDRFKEESDYTDSINLSLLDFQDKFTYRKYADMINKMNTEQLRGYAKLQLFQRLAEKQLMRKILKNDNLLA